MSYTPLTKQQADDMARPPLIDDGTYQFQLLEYSHTGKNSEPLTDRNGDPMTKIKIKIWDHEGKERVLFTMLFWGEQNRMSFRTRHFADSIKMQESYEQGHLFDRFGECLNKTGYCEIYTQKPREKNDGSGEMWPAKNDIRDFVPENEVIKAEPKKEIENFKDCEIPF